MSQLFDTTQMSLFYALLAVAAEVAVVAAVAVAVTSRRLLATVRDDLRGVGTWFALVVAAVATSGSLYFSEVAHFVPCRLCWWQRGLMYPLVPILLVAALRPALRARRLALPMVAIGAAIASYHSAISRWPSLEIGSCSLTNPCTLEWVKELGYVTIPVMSLSAFLLIGVLLLLDRGTA